MSSEDRLGVWLSLHLFEKERLLSFAYLIYRFLETVEEDIGVGGRVEVTATNYGTREAAKYNPHSADGGTPRERNEVLQQLTSAAHILCLSISRRVKTRKASR
jgi:hypothetical protein